MVSRQQLLDTGTLLDELVTAIGEPDNANAVYRIHASKKEQAVLAERQIQQLKELIKGPFHSGMFF